MNVQFSERQRESLAAMAEALNTTSAGAIAMALALLEVAIREKKLGNSLGIVRGEKVVKELVGIWESEA